MTYNGADLTFTHRRGVIPHSLGLVIALGLACLLVYPAVILLFRIVIFRKRIRLPILTKVVLSGNGLTIDRNPDSDAETEGAQGAVTIPISCIASIRKSNYERGVWIDAPGYVKETIFEGRSDAQAIADTLNRRLKQLREAEG